MTKNNLSDQKTSYWSAIFAMSFCVTVLIAAEFMPVSLLTPIAQGLHSTPGQTGQAISISGFFAMIAALLTSTFIGNINRKYILLCMTVSMLASLVIIALAPDFKTLMLARAILGSCIGGFWSLATSIVMRLVPPHQTSKALGSMYMGQALATAFAAPIGSYLEIFIGWRGIFWLLVPLAAINLLWLAISLPPLPSTKKTSPRTLISLLKRPYFLRGMICMALTFGGAFTMFTYLRPYLEHTMGLTVTQITLCFLVLGCAGFAGGSLGSKLVQSYPLKLLQLIPIIMGGVTITLLISKDFLIIVLILLGLWGVMNTAISIGWMGWMSQNVKDQPEAAGSLMVAIIQGSILCGSALGGETLELTGIIGTFTSSTILSLLALICIGSGKKLLACNVS